MLEILLKIPVADINYIENEHSIENYYDSRGIRMDVYVKDSDRIFDIEMQTGDYDNPLLRTRYYQSASDIESTPRRTKYSELKASYIILFVRKIHFEKDFRFYRKT